MNRCLLFLAVAPLSVMAAPADPYTRDADISGTVLDVEYTQRADGLYEYVYTLRAPVTNLDAIGELYIDLRCKAEFPPALLPAPPEKQSYFGNRVAEGTISPSVIGADYGAAASFSIFTHGHAYWGFTVSRAPKIQACGSSAVRRPGCAITC